jgi:hypothetical protein
VPDTVSLYAALLAIRNGADAWLQSNKDARATATLEDIIKTGFNDLSLPESDPLFAELNMVRFKYAANIRPFLVDNPAQIEMEDLISRVQGLLSMATSLLDQLYAR